MSYLLNPEKFYLQQSNTPSRQTVSTTYIEITGSKCQVTTSSTVNVLYQFEYYISTNYTFGTGGAYDKILFHVKLQKSNDNFSSNIVDIAGTKHNVSGDTVENRDYYYTVSSPTFFTSVDSNDYLRLVIRAYSTSNEGYLHQMNQFDGSSPNQKIFDTSLLVAEI